MGIKKIYECCICHRILEEEKPIRLHKLEYGSGGYNQYGYVEKHDFCEKCYEKIERWIDKHNEETRKDYLFRKKDKFKQVL